jgi:hypothetical protein
MAFLSDPAKRRFFIVVAAIVAVYLPSRLYLLCVHPSDSDIDLYARYAFIHQYAAEKGVPFHDLYRTMGLADIGSAWSLSYDSLALTVVAYPPLALAFIEAPTLLARGGHPVSLMSLADFTARYRTLFRWLCALFELVAVVIVSLLLLDLYKRERTVATVVRMGILCLAGYCMPHIMYDRLDIILSTLLVLSLAALIKRMPLLSFFIFACAVNYKVVPIFLLPIWVFGSLRSSDFQQPSGQKRLFHLLWQSVARSMVLCGMIAGIFLVFYFMEGKGVFDFFMFHRDRGVHIESTWGTLALLAARLGGTPFHIVNSYGAYNVITPVTKCFSLLSLPFLAAALLALTIGFWLRCVKSCGRQSQGGALLLSPQSIIATTLLFLCVVFSCSRIFSPHYLFVLVPLAALIPYTGKGSFVFVCILVGVCCFSTLIYPYFYSRAILDGLTGFGLYLLAARSLLLLVMTGFILVWAISQGRNIQNNGR